MIYRNFPFVKASSASRPDRFTALASESRVKLKLGRPDSEHDARRLTVPIPSTVGLFVLAALALLLTPGPAVLYIVARSVNQGRRAGLASVLGIEVGNLVHVAAAALGISALLLSSALAFSALKYLGAAYLI